MRKLIINDGVMLVYSPVPAFLTTPFPFVALVSVFVPSRFFFAVAVTTNSFEKARERERISYYYMI